MAGIYFLISAGLLRAARKNYERHVAKMASLLTAVLTQSQDEEDEAA